MLCAEVVSLVGAEQETLASKQVGGVSEMTCPSEDLYLLILFPLKEALHVYVHLLCLCGCMWCEVLVLMGGGPSV